MGLKVYYIVEIFIFTAIGIYALLKPGELSKIILKNENNKLINIIRILGIIALLNAVMNINKLLWWINHNFSYSNNFMLGNTRC